MRTGILFICLFLTLSLNAQHTYYVAAYSGLNMREKPETTAKVLDKIPYGQKISITIPAENAKESVVNGFKGKWATVTYNGKTGFILDCYLFPVPPPSDNTFNLEDYFKQISAPVSPLFKLENQKESASESYQSIEKQLFKNGFELHTYLGYEVSSSTYFLPGLTLQQAFILLCLLDEYKKFLNHNTPFPSGKGQNNHSDSNQSLTLDDSGDIVISYEEGELGYYIHISESNYQTVIKIE